MQKQCVTHGSFSFVFTRPSMNDGGLPAKACAPALRGVARAQW
ncbi:hypothetical protein ART_0468 [Arthrobacter sp. PAMC 25486]|nr:hypothetical protein ART_0468 [Arthrobacter sp. PAMC 25486]